LWHPWETTLRNLIDRVRGQFGEGAAEGIAALAKLRRLPQDEILEEEVLRSLLVGAGVSPEDFGLHAEN
jgi:hypothetical protein